MDAAFHGADIRRGRLTAAVAVLALLAALPAVVGIARFGGGWVAAAPPPAPSAAPRAEAAPAAFRDLRFEDRSDGAVVVLAADTGAVVAVLDPGTNGFVRGTLRGLTRERGRDEKARAAPFRVAEWANGRITLQDRATGRMVELDAFGHTNAQAFARFLTASIPREGTP